MTLKDYLYKRSTKPLMSISFKDTHISGRIYGICTPEVTKYKYTISVKDPRFGRTFSHEVMRKSWMDSDLVEKMEKAGWKWDFIHPYSGYEFDCLTKTEPFTELPKGENLVGVTWHEIIKGRSNIEEYLRYNFRGFAPISIYRVPESLL